MRKIFAKLMAEHMRRDERIFLLAADLGYGVLDDIFNEFPARVLNVGAAEQLMVCMAVGLALGGKIPVCYSISPFATDRPYGAIKLYLEHGRCNVKLVGVGRNRDYLDAGITHWESNNPLAVPVARPETGDELEVDVATMLLPGPFYLNLRK